jgi:hypothetical protein
VSDACDRAEHSVLIPSHHTIHPSIVKERFPRTRRPRPVFPEAVTRRPDMRAAKISEAREWWGAGDL